MSCRVFAAANGFSPLLNGRGGGTADTRWGAAGEVGKNSAAPKSNFGRGEEDAGLYSGADKSNRVRVGRSVAAEAPDEGGGGGGRGSAAEEERGPSDEGVPTDLLFTSGGAVDVAFDEAFSSPADLDDEATTGAATTDAYVAVAFLTGSDFCALADESFSLSAVGAFAPRADATSQPSLSTARSDDRSVFATSFSMGITALSSTDGASRGTGMVYISGLYVECTL